MELISTNLPPNHDIALFTCLHEGTIYQHKEGIKQLVDYVASNENTYAAGLGDWAESICVDHPHYDITSVDNPADLIDGQYHSMSRRIKPIKDKMLFALLGNHDWRLARTKGNPVRNILCKELGIRYGSFSCKLIVKDKKGKLMYKLFATHGMKTISSSADDPIRQEANEKLVLKRHLYKKAGDCVIMAKGHAHKLIISEPSKKLYLMDTGGRIKQSYQYNIPTDNYIDKDLRWYTCVGSFLKQYAEPIWMKNVETGEPEKVPVSGYAEMSEYDPVELGYVIVEVRDKQVANVRKVIL